MNDTTCPPVARADFRSAAPSQRTIRVAIAHANPWLAVALRSAGGNEIEIVAAVGTSEAASLAEKFALSDPDVLLIGIDPHSFDPAEFVDAARGRGLHRPMVALARRFSDYLVWQLGRLGFRGAIEDGSATPASVTQLLATAAHGQACFPQSFLLSRQRMLHDSRAFPRLLTERQIDVLRCVAHGQSDGEVGTRLGLSAATAKRHRADLSRKLGGVSAAALMRESQRLGFADVPSPNIQQ